MQQALRQKKPLEFLPQEFLRKKRQAQMMPWHYLRQLDLAVPMVLRIPLSTDPLTVRGPRTAAQALKQMRKLPVKPVRRFLQPAEKLPLKLSALFWQRLRQNLAQQKFSPLVSAQV